jgi:hypothetical protein
MLPEVGMHKLPPRMTNLQLQMLIARVPANIHVIVVNGRSATVSIGNTTYPGTLRKIRYYEILDCLKHYEAKLSGNQPCPRTVVNEICSSENRNKQLQRTATTRPCLTRLCQTQCIGGGDDCVATVETRNIVRTKTSTHYMHLIQQLGKYEPQCRSQDAEKCMQRETKSPRKIGNQTRTLFDGYIFLLRLISR